jgi:hypothetical protein
MTNEDKIKKLSAALGFYADPDSYFAIGIFPDHPCGNFINDFDNEHGNDQYDRPMPGRYARMVLKEIGKK